MLKIASTGIYNLGSRNDMDDSQQSRLRRCKGTFRQTFSFSRVSLDFSYLCTYCDTDEQNLEYLACSTTKRCLLQSKVILESVVL